MSLKKKTTRSLEAAELEAKAKAIRRAEKAFWEEVLDRADEVKIKLGLSDKFDDICNAYGAYTESDQHDLFNYLMNKSQIDYYHNEHSDLSD